MTKRLKLFACSFICLLGCNVKVPSPQEQDKLVEMGAFPNGTPAWVGGAGPGVARADAGLIPQSFSAPHTVRTRPVNRMQAELATEHNRKLEPALAQVESAAVAPVPTDDSPLHRITKQCPTIESDVTTALTTTELKRRSELYASLVKRCPSSYDLWLWLGKDYLASENLTGAGKAFERVLTLDSGNEEATRLLDQVRERQKSTKK